MKRLKLILAAMLIAFAILSCSDSEQATTVSCSSVEVSFSSDVLPVILTSCSESTACHASGSDDGVFTTYAQVYASRSKIKSEVSSGSMPRGSKLSSDEKNAILCWIENGASNN